MKAKTKETALSSSRQYNKNPQQNLSKEEVVALTNLSKNKDIVIQKSGNGNYVVIVDKGTYIKRMKRLLSDQRKFEKSYFEKWHFSKLCSYARKAYRRYF